MAWADRTPVERVAIDYCAPRGIPLSLFNGQAVYPGNPAWLDGDRDAVFDWLEKEAARCDGCGQDRAESTKKENSFAYRAEGVTCHACRAMHRAGVKLAGEGVKEDPQAGVRYRVWRIEDGD